MEKIDKKEFQKRLDRMTEIFSDMVVQADEMSRTRCPYRDRHDRCTAAFRCRHQIGDGPPACGHDGNFDYRTAWETKPETYERAKRKIQAVKAGRAARDGAATRDGAAKGRKPGA